MSIMTKTSSARAGKLLETCDDIFDQLRQSPQLVLYFEELKHIIEEEHRKRQQFYETITEDQKVEFINGKIIMHSPAKLQHNVITKRLLVLLDAYVTAKNMGYVGYEKLLISLTRNDYEPDVCFFCKEKADLFTPDQWQFPAPDFIAEVLSDSTEARDRGDKFVDYAAHGVEEYWIIDPGQETVEQYRLEENTYILLCKTYSGTLKSIAVIGFEVPVDALFDDTEKQNTLRQLLVS